MPIKYTDTIDPNWAAAAVESFKVMAKPDTDDPVLLDLDGACPRCDHPMSHTEPLVAFRGVVAADPDTLRQALRASGLMDDQPRLPAEFSVRCSCQAKHPDPLGRGKSGCGAVWKMRIEPFDGDHG